MEKTGILSRPCFRILVGGLLTLAVYAHVLRGEFVYDDYRTIVDNAALGYFSSWQALWDHFQTRFVAYLTFAVNYQLFRLEPFSYHLFNIALHLCNGVLVYRMIRLLLETPSGHGRSRSVDAGDIAWAGSLIFLLHPLQTQAVSFVSQRIAVLAATFYLLTVFFYLRFRVHHTPVDHLFALLTAILAMLTKEISFTIPFMLTAIEYYFFIGDAPPFKERARWLLPFFLTLGIIPLCLLLGLQHERAIASLLRETPLLPRAHYFLTELRVMITYLRLLVFPVHQNLDYDFPVATTFWNIPTVASSVGLAALLGLGFALRKKQALLSFSIVWFFLTLAVESTVIPIDDVIQEHRLYLPMAGFALFLPVMLEQTMNSRRLRQSVTVGILVFLAVLTYQRNELWKSEVAILQDTIRKSPQKTRGYLNLSRAYLRRADFANAYRYLEPNLSIGEESAPEGVLESPGPELLQKALNLLENRRPEEALKIAKLILRTNTDAQTLTGFGSVFAAYRYNTLAYALFLKALAHGPDYVDAYLEFSKNLANFNNYYQARRLLKTAKEKGLTDVRIDALLAEINRLSPE